MSTLPAHSPAARRAFVLANTRLRPVPHAPEISLYVADEATPLWLRTEEELGEIGLPPPFWAFAWAGGQALARYVLDNPALVQDRRVLDFASGSGLVALAAARAGAASVDAAEIDPFALAALALNAAANGVSLRALEQDQIGLDDGWETVLAGDICYERGLAARVIDWLAGLAARGAVVLVGDPGRAYLPKERLVPLISYAVPVTRELEDLAIKQTTVWQLKP
ncbi:MAG: 50S ribosomal protein L11 methyltransferase [Hyphomicrobiales bacterium]|jgi:predicted nicotinamide N-methyase|nr:50S ribosomal protein L11 methyltransferase [Hyphomicrobiales bacterium]